MLNYLKGKKTYIVGIIAILYGITTHNYEIVFTGLAAMGLRDGLNTVVAKMLAKG